MNSGGGHRSPQKRPNNIKTMSPQDFLFMNKIGSGSYSEVYKAKYKTAIDDYNNNRQHFFAIKICSKDHIIREQKEKYVNVEKLTLLKLASKMIHPGIVNLYYTFHDTYNLYFVLDYISCGELFTYLYNNLNKSMIQDYKIIEKFVAQLLDTLKYLEVNSIVHRDLKPENILLNKKGCLMITDFGVACDLSTIQQQSTLPQGLRATSFVGTADYVSPELLLTNSCSYKADIWAIGCIFYQLRQGCPPFRGKNELETFENIVSGNHKPMVNLEDNAEYMDLVRNLLLVDEDTRLSVDQAMNHPFCKNINWDLKNQIWTGIWEGPYPLDVNGEYYLNKSNAPTNVISNSNNVNNSPTKNTNNTVRTKGIGIPRKRKPITTQNIVEWRKQLGINGSTSAVSSGVPIIEKGFRNMQMKDPSEHMNTNSGYTSNTSSSEGNISSRAAAQIVLKRQMMKNGSYQNQMIQPAPPPPQPQRMKVATKPPAVPPKNRYNGIPTQPRVNESSNVLKRETNILYHKISYLEIPKSSNIYLDYHTFNKGISQDAHNCELFMGFMDVNADKILQILKSENTKKKQENNSLEVYNDGTIKIYNQGDKNGVLVGDLTNEMLNVYEYTPKRRKGEVIEDKGAWCIIESNDKSIYLMPYLSKDWNKLFKQIKKKNKSKRGDRVASNDEMMIKNAASMAYNK